MASDTRHVAVSVVVVALAVWSMAMVLLGALALAVVVASIAVGVGATHWVYWHRQVQLRRREVELLATPSGAAYPLVASPSPQVAQSDQTRGWLGRWLHRMRRTR